MDGATIAVDVAKNVFQIAVSQRPGKVSEAHRLPRGRFLRFFAQRPACTVIMEACGTAHFWGRELQAMGHVVRLLPPHAVRPYVHRSKTDRADAEALLEAGRNGAISAVPVKSVAQQSIMALHAIRAAWRETLTARYNLARSVLGELGHAVPKGAVFVVGAVRRLTGDGSLPTALHQPLAVLCEEIEAIAERIDGLEKQLQELAKGLAPVGRLRTIPGVGLLTATALVAFVGDVQRFANGRRFASYLGLTPRERSSGERRFLGKISKAGDGYLRMLLITGARASLASWRRHVPKAPDRLRAWAIKIERVKGNSTAAVALANKLARIVWAVWARQDEFASQPVAA